MSPPSPLTVYLIDAFTTNGNTPFTGNGAGVFFLNFDDDYSDEVKQKMSAEVNQANSGFVSKGWSKESPITQSDDLHTPTAVIKRTLRWFTPQQEVPLCGHATLASVKALIESVFGDNPSALKSRDEVVIEFESKYRGPLGAVYDCRTGRITLNFPSNPPIPLYANGEKWIGDLIDAIISPELTTDSIQEMEYSASMKIIILRLGDHLNENDLRKIKPDVSRMLKVENCDDMFGVLVTVKGRNGNVDSEIPHFFSRFFAPWVGVNEDPVCGSAHTVLTPYWTKEYCTGIVKFGNTLLARQHSTRGGNLYCTLLENERVTLAGDARVVIKGEIFP